MRTTYIVTYDIAGDKRLRQAFKICANFGNHLQYSVFECDLNPKERLEMEQALRDINTMKTKSSSSPLDRRKAAATA